MVNVRFAVMNAIALTLLVVLSSSPLHAAQGDCGQPVSSGAQPTASDCLRILRVSVGSDTCARACICDTNGIGGTTASDALVCLKKAVGQDVDLGCRCPASPVGDEIQVNSYPVGDQGRPAVAADAAGKIVVAWDSAADSDGASVQAQRFSSDGAAAGTEFQVNTFTTGDQLLVTVAADPDGGFIAAWDNAGASPGDGEGSVRARRFDSSGTPIGTEFQANTYTAGAQGSAAVAIEAATGDFVVVWQSYGSSGTDTSNFSIQGQRYDSGGNPAGTEFQVNTLTPDSQTAPAVTFRDGGGFVVLWSTAAGSGTDPDANVRGQLFGADGARESTEFRINSYTTGTQASPAVTSDGANGFVVVWHSAGSTIDADYAIVARHFGPTGTSGGEFPINTFTTGAQTDARVTLLDQSRYVVVWNSEGSSAGDADNSIQGQVFGTDDVAISTEFQVNAYTTGDQLLADVAAVSSRNFTVVWQSDGSPAADSDGTSIQAQRFQ
jgi:hypothetical protein